MRCRLDPLTCQTRRPRALRAAGFTLVELLVVLGIIIVLVGILVPAVAGARKESRKTVCKAQLQQIGYAFRMYTDQNKGRYPRASSLPSVNPNNYPLLTETIGPFVGNDQRVFHCPSDETLYPTERISYFYNAELADRPVAQTFFYLVYRDMTRVPIAWDADHFHGGSLPFNWLFIDGHVEHFLAGADKSGT